MCVRGEGRVPRHEVVEAWRGDEGGNEANQVVVHVARIPQRCGTGGHYGRYLRGRGVTVGGANRTVVKVMVYTHKNAPTHNSHTHTHTYTQMQTHTYNVHTDTHTHTAITLCAPLSSPVG